MVRQGCELEQVELAVVADIVVAEDSLILVRQTNQLELLVCGNFVELLGESGTLES